MMVNAGWLVALLYQVVLAVVATMLLLKWLIFRRRTTLGRVIARNNLTIAIAYLAAALAVRFGFFRTAEWRVFIALVVLATASHVTWEIVVFFGGWRGVLDELALSLVELGEDVRRVASTVRERLALLVARRKR